MSRHAPAPEVSESINLSALRLSCNPAREMLECYTRVKKLGSGSFGTVFHVRSTASQQDRAMKVVVKSRVRQDAALVETEIEALLRMDHPNVVKFYEFFEQQEFVCVVTELCTCGDFSQLLGGCCQESELQALFRDVVTGAAYCHGRGIAHRDLKLQNCLLTAGKHRRVAKVIDFGLAAIRREQTRGDSWLQGTLGTWLYVAPEVHANTHYGVECDMWSLGIMLYVLLTDKDPFAEDSSKSSRAKAAKAMREGRIYWAPLEAASIAPEARGLTRGLLVRAPAQRLSAVAALKKPWLAAAAETGARESGCAELLHRLTSFKDLPRFTKVVLMLAAQLAACPDVEAMRQAFLALDRSLGGALSRDDIKQGFANWGHRLGEGQLDAIFESLDVDGDRRVSWAEWLSAAHGPDALARPAVVDELFRFFDADGNQTISQDELCRVVGDEEAQRVLSRSGSLSGNLRPDHFQMLAAEMASEQSAALLAA